MAEQNYEDNFHNKTIGNPDLTEEGENIMGSIAELISAMAAFGILKAWNAREDERNYRREEEFVPFRLPSLPRQEQPISLPREKETPEETMTASASH